MSQPSRTVTSTTCPMDCPDACSLEVTSAGDRVVAIGAGPHNPDTAGFICSKIARFGDRVHHSSRLAQPLIRTGPKGSGEFAPATWDDVIPMIADRLRAIARDHGPEAIVPYSYGGSNGWVSDGLIDALFFERLGATRLDKTICAAPTAGVAQAMYGKMPGVAYADYPEAKTIIVWGANPKVSHIHLMPYLREAKRRGAFIAVVDPQKNYSDREIDLHLPVRPGTDLPVALAMIRHWNLEGRIDHEFLAANARGADRLFEQAEAWTIDRAAEAAGLTSRSLLQLADAYADASPAVIRVGWGMERNRNGGQAVAAVMAMPALLGKFGVRGGGYTMSNSAAAQLDRQGLFGDQVSDGGRKTPRTMNMVRLGAWLTDGPQADGAEGPPVKALFVYNCNPVATVPDQNRILAGLARDDLFTVVFDQVLTDSALWADVVLPATTFLEQRDLRVGYGSYVVGGTRPALDRVGESRPNTEVFAALGRALGFEDEAFDWDDDEAFAQVAKRLRLGERSATDGDVENLTRGEQLTYRFNGHDSQTPIQFETVRPQTPDGRVELTPEILGDEPYRYRSPTADSPWPLALVTPGSHRMISSTLGELELQALTVTLHPEDAESRGLESGQTVRVHNELGEVICPLVVSRRIRPGVAMMPKGTWNAASINGAGSTALCPADIGEVAGGACFNDARVDVEGWIEP